MFVIGRLFEPTLIDRVTPLFGDREFVLTKFHEVDMSIAHLNQLGSV
jgi:hypothetical protein